MPRPRGTGCITCRIRRIKCDGGKPHCRRCVSTGRKCDGYMPVDSKLSRRDLAAAAREPPPSIWRHYEPTPTQPSLALFSYPGTAAKQDLRDREYHLFDLFRSNTAPPTTSFMPSKFWARDVLQLAHSEPAVWHAAVALAAIQNRWKNETLRMSTSDIQPSSQTNEAELHYYRAITRAREMREPTQLLALSITLGSAANLMGRLRESRIHLVSGRRILSQSGLTDATEQAAEMLARLDLEAMSFSEATAPYEHEDTDVFRQMLLDNENIASYEQAAGSLFRMLRICMLAGQVPSVPDDSGFPEDLVSALETWEKSVAALEAKRKERRGADEKDDMIPALAIRMYHTLLRLFGRVSFLGPQIRYDEHLNLFERLILLCEGLSRRMQNAAGTITMELGLIVVLFVVGARCRHPKIRHRTIRLLTNLKRQEGLWRSDATAACIQTIMDIEYDELRLYTAERDTQDVPSVNEHTSDTDNAGKDPEMSTEELEKRLTEAMAVPWDVWSDPKFLLPCHETWDEVAIIPEVCRVKQAVPSISIAERCISATVYISSGNDENPIRSIRNEKAWF
ncbi:hypothetical protein FDECE_13891 [Fusarium decemcellulare]|nr:hypothetical protein FDECE_13891 [Fusarium decemcellulare]